MLGREDPYAMLDGMDDRLFQRWQQFALEEPFGPAIENLMRARIASFAAQTPIDEAKLLPDFREL